MTDMEKRERVIKALELCTSKIETRTQIPCETCPYHNRKYHGVLGDGCCNVRSLQRDVLTLLKAQEPVKPKSIDTSNSKLYHNDMFKNHYCGNCGEFLHVVNRKDMFCSQCGRKVKWE